MSHEEGKGGNTGWQKYTNEEVIAALLKAGTKLGASVIVGCNRATIDAYCDKHPEIEKAVLEAKEILVDIAETGLMKRVKEGHAPSIFFVCRTLGKDRGYSTRVEAVGKDGAPIESEIVIKSNNNKIHDIISSLMSQSSEESPEIEKKKSPNKKDKK